MYFKYLFVFKILINLMFLFNINFQCTKIQYTYTNILQRIVYILAICLVYTMPTVYKSG
jgi:hypothetical protein